MDTEFNNLNIKSYNDNNDITDNSEVMTKNKKVMTT